MSPSRGLVVFPSQRTVRIHKATQNGTRGSEVNYVTLGQGWLFLKRGLHFDIDAFPTSPTAAGLIKGDVYRSGDTLKIKTTD